MKTRYHQPNRGLLAELPEEAMTDRWLRVKCDPLWRCTNNCEREGAVLDWRKGLPIGNGDIGATIHGYNEHGVFTFPTAAGHHDVLERVDCPLAQVPVPALS